jgi:hypothetical protein
LVPGKLPETGFDNFTIVFSLRVHFKVCNDLDEESRYKQQNATIVLPLRINIRCVPMIDREEGVCDVREMIMGNAIVI